MATASTTLEVDIPTQGSCMETDPPSAPQCSDNASNCESVNGATIRSDVTAFVPVSSFDSSKLVDNHATTAEQSVNADVDIAMNIESIMVDTIDGMNEMKKKRAASVKFIFLLLFYNKLE